MRCVEAGRGKKGTLYGRTPGPTVTWEQVEDGKGGNHKEEGRHGSCEELLGTPQTAWEGSAYEWWRPAGRSAI